MIRLLAVALLAAGLLVAGCGGDDDDGADQADTATQTQPETTPTDTQETETDTTEEEREAEPESGDDDSPVPGASREQLEQAIESCKENVRQAPQLSDDAKDDLEELCEEAASGDPEELRKVSREVCKRIIADTLPAGEQRDQALRLCDQSGGGN